MEPNQIKDADILDILFEGRNKAYGAYELRRTYNRRMVKSMVVMGSVVLLLFLGGVVSGLGKVKRGAKIDVGGDVELLKAVTDPPPVVPPPPRVVPPVATLPFTTPRIVKDDVIVDVKPPEIDSLNNVRIGTTASKGATDDGIVGPPPTDGVVSGVVTGPKKDEADNRFIPVEKEAEFPGGMLAWGRFLNRNLHVPDEAVNGGVNGTVVVQFVVDVDGSVSDVVAVSGPEEGGLKEEAVRVIKKSGKWVPALQNGRYVKAYRRQPVVFKVVDGN